MSFIGLNCCLQLVAAFTLILPASAWPYGLSEAVAEASDQGSKPVPESQATPRWMRGGHPQRHYTIEDVLGPFYKSEPGDKAVPQDLTPQRQNPPVGADTAARVRYWNEVMLDANGRDHTPGLPDQVFGEQLGPHRTSRAFAIVQIAVFDALNAVRGGYESYTGLTPVGPGVSADAAVAQAAHDTLAALYPSQRAIFRAELAADLARLPDDPARMEGSKLGQRAASAILALRENDGAQQREPQAGVDFLPSEQPGKWRPDPVSMSPLALGAYWGRVRPFVLKYAEQFDAPPFPPLASDQYTAAFEEVKRLGGDGVLTPTERTPAQTVAGIYWAYDGTPGLGTPSRLYNQIAVQLAQKQGVNDALQLARLLALVNVGMADAAIAVWNTKYDDQVWRPVTAIREADQDGNPATEADPQFTPLGAPASNLSGPDFTPPFPAYTSGHAAFGGTLFQILRKYFGTDQIAFTFVSDELNGVTRDNDGSVRPLIPRSFASLSEAEEENGQSRIYLGVHWRFDKTRGIEQGRLIANFVFQAAFAPLEQQGANEYPQIFQTRSQYRLEEKSWAPR
jgi:hypothetical protein